MMENTDIDMVIDIPDTPDRVSRSGSLSREGNKRENDATAVGCPREFHLIDCNYRSGRDRMVLGGVKNSKHQMESQNNCNGLHASRSTPLFRRPTMEKDKGKSICASASIQKNPVLNLSRRNGFAHVLEMGTPKCLPSEGIPISSGFPSQGAQNSFNVAGEKNKAKEKIDDCSCGLACSASVRETLDLFSDTRYKKKDPAVSSTRPVIRASGHRRLVRNGCISPHAIAAKGKEGLEQQTSSNGDINNRNGEEKRASDDSSSVDIREIVAEDDILCRAKGKRVTVHSQTSKDDGASINGDSMGSSDAVESEGWRSTRNHQMTMGCSRPRNNNGRHHETSRRGENDSQRTFRSVPSRVEEHEISAVDWEANKRLRSFNGCEVSDEHQVSIGGTSGEASNPRPARIQNHQRRGMHNLVFEIDDSSLEVQPARGVENIESNVRARQIEADERLARELQEQLYQEAQIFGDEEINETIARMLQEEENTVGASSSRNPRISNPTSSVAQGRSRLRTRFQQSYSNRGPNIPQTRASVRTSRPRGHFLGPQPSALSRALDLRFPSEMALESRLDILEELETVIGQFGSSMNGGLLQLDRDFNEDDYEMLLALDENNDNDRCVGISANQINSFPQSTVQNDNFEETCVICLETPSTGDVIRHLPCLHKFHKDCIDPWLGRSKSCPVCKCSVT